MPYHGPGSSELGKPLRSILHATPDIPIWLGSGGDAMLRLCGELCDGLMPLRFVPGQMDRLRKPIEEGFERAGNGKSWKDFSIEAGVGVILTNDVSDALRRLKPNVALYVGGMGAPSLNFHKQTMEQRGYAEVANRVQELFLAGRKEEAAAAIPDEYVDDGALVGPPARIESRYAAWAESGITGLHIATSQAGAIELIADIARRHRAVGMPI